MILFYVSPSVTLPALPAICYLLLVNGQYWHSAWKGKRPCSQTYSCNRKQMSHIVQSADVRELIKCRHLRA